MATTRCEDLAQIEAALWQELARATQQPGHAWRVAVLATTDGELADARSVVLRELDADSRRLLIYTDARSLKARQAATHPLGTLVLWSADLGWQLRLRVLLDLQTAGLAVASRWARLKATPAAQDYMSPLPPGASLDGPPTSAAPPPPKGRDYFAVLAAEVQVIDWLELSALGHRRAVFERQSRRWVTP